MAATWATDFKLKSSSGSFATYVVKLDETVTVQSGKTILELCGDVAQNNFAYHGFNNLLHLNPKPVRAELIMKTAKRIDPQGELEELRLTVAPLVAAFEGKYGTTHVQEYYGVDYPKQLEYPGVGYVLTEACVGLPLNEVMRLKTQLPHEYTIIRYTKQILEGLAFLHESGIIHRDIKCANVIVLQDEKTLKITGLALAKCFSEPQTPPTFLEGATGTVPFISPEMAELSVAARNKFPHVGRKTDIWSFGCLLIEMLQKGTPPLLTNGRESVDVERKQKFSFADLNRYLKTGYKIQRPTGDTCGHGCTGKCHLLTSDVEEILNMSLTVDSAKRHSAAGLLQSSYFYPFVYAVMPVITNMEQQRWSIRRYQLKTPEEIESENPVKRSNAQVPVELEESYKRAETKNLLDKMVLPEMMDGTVTPGSVSVMSPLDARSKSEVLNKARLFELLIEKRSETEHVIKHLAVRANNAVELRIFTESSGSMEWLSSVIKTNAFRTNLIPNFTKQILEGLCFLHRNGIIHKDIRGSSILVERSEDSTSEWLLKIAHFEKASHFSGDSTPRNFISSPEGSSRFASKEMQELLSFDIQEPENVGRGTDVYSLGCTVIEMYQRREPRWVHKDKKLKEYKYEFTQPDTNLTAFLANMYNLLIFRTEPDTSEVKDSEALKFVKLCFKRPLSRPTCERLLSHSFITGLKPPVPAEKVLLAEELLPSSKLKRSSSV